MKKKKEFWYTASGYAVIFLLILAAMMINFYPGGYGYVYSEETNEMTLERGMIFKEYKTIEVPEDEGLRYSLYEVQVESAIQTWIFVLMLSIFSVYLLQRVIPAYRNRKEQGIAVKDIIAALLLAASLTTIVMLLISLSNHLQYLSQVFNSAP
ncbi:hypothetical protein [Jeotgalibacillus proteolyticus]|uniref:Uncharacterized protein n=1 Tax=Jeotgalibacillus proteolyticus TaxID=2082395 RepID=A0A2S5GC82_9BACL|nr:hypothetical protein [Jeotgalibacillus proteolyticus]PPA70606.1 hypothetical protein C4B60_07335 [Jeotgalibacillus proteolyticus]